jgi:hypothetical protein
MNERIKELVKEATIRVNNPLLNSAGKVVCDNWEEGISISKFAELIIHRCADIAMHEDQDPAECIKKHFGVKE